MRWCELAVLLPGALLLCSPSLARFDPAAASVESPAVAARFPDPAVEYDTPGFRSGRTDFTSSTPTS